MAINKLAALASLLTEPLDLFLCSASFEARCRSITDNIDTSKILRAAIAQNENHAWYLKNNPEYLRAKFQANVSELHFDTDNPLKIADELWKLFSEVFQEGPKKVLIDVSTFTHEALLIALRATRALARTSDSLRFAYVPAQEYSVGDADEHKWLSKGIREIRSVLGYPGELLPSRKIHLIVLVGFEPERARALIEAYEPNLISLGYSAEASSTSEKNFRAHKFFHERMMTLFPTSRKFTFASNDFSKTAAALEAEIVAQPGYNVVIAPLNTKLSTIGSGLAAVSNETIQICYAQPELYNVDNYSLPADTFHLFSIPGLGKD